MRLMKALPVVMAGLAAGAEQAAAQRLLKWPVRTSAAADAIVTGPTATFWNPAAVSVGAHRTEALIVNLRTPEELALNGIAAAVAHRLERTVLAVGYEHVGVDGVTQTTSSPIDATTQLELGEDHFTLAAAHEVGPSLTVGATARYARDNISGTDPSVALGAGFLAQLDLPLSPRVGGYAVSEVDDLHWAGAAEITLPTWLGDAYRFGASYGTAWDDAGAGFLTHRLSGQAAWRERAMVSAGLAHDGSSEGPSWQPLLAASLRFNRYTLGVARETLSGDFGATYSFRLQVGIGR